MSSRQTANALSRVTRGSTKLFGDDRGKLGVIDLARHVPFVPVRIFWISDVPAGKARGGHAHKACSQFVVCLHGRVVVDAFDGTKRERFVLEAGDFINLVPGIFATEEFVEPDSLLLVVCDRPYEPDDYIHDKNALKTD
jgi:UDP-2-acetamido-3-amino-2,3-dideoxy-glucuronate N-acetyltransferase